jgi:hypothetical protein
MIADLIIDYFLWNALFSMLFVLNYEIGLRKL